MLAADVVMGMVGVAGAVTVVMVVVSVVAATAAAEGVVLSNLIHPYPEQPFPPPPTLMK